MLLALTSERAGHDVVSGVRGVRVLDDTVGQVRGYARQGVGFGYTGLKGLNAPFGHRQVRVVWRKRVWRCLEPVCAMVTFTETHQRRCCRGR